MCPSDSTTSVGSDSWNRQNQLNGMPHVEARVWTRLSAVVRADLVDALLVLVPLFLRDQQLGQGAVDAFHQGVGGQPGAEHQLAGAVQQRSAWSAGGGSRRRLSRTSAASVRLLPDGARLCRRRDDAHQIRPAGGETGPRPGG